MAIYVVKGKDLYMEGGETPVGHVETLISKQVLSSLLANPAHTVLVHTFEDYAAMYAAVTPAVKAQVVCVEALDRLLCDATGVKTDVDATLVTQGYMLAGGSLSVDSEKTHSYVVAVVEALSKELHAHYSAHEIQALVGVDMAAYNVLLDSSLKTPVVLAVDALETVLTELRTREKELEENGLALATACCGWE